MIVADLSPAFVPQCLDPQHGDLAVDLGLDLLQPDQRVELGQQLLERLLRLGLRLAAAVAGSAGSGERIAVGGGLVR